MLSDTTPSRARTPVLALVATALTAIIVVAAAMVSLNSGRAAAASVPTGLHVSGNRLLDHAGAAIVLRGVNRSGSEYACIQGFGFFDGPSDAASISAMAAWHINTVRVPLNEDCWLGINGAPAAYAGANYRAAIAAYVKRLHSAGLIAVLDLHWTAAGTARSTGQQNMPDADHAGAFWTSVASTFRTDGSVVFDLFNEPHDVSWTCWRDGGDCGLGYRVAGMQSLLNAVRATGATNPVLVGGLAYSNDLSAWLANRPSDPSGNLMASWHSYNFNSCRTVACWNSQIAPVADAVPLVAGELGENDCAHSYLDGLLPWLDSHAAGYLGWGWDTFDCSGFPSLISDYSGTPTNFGIGLRNHLAALGGAPAPSSTPPTPPTSTPPSTRPVPPPPPAPRRLIVHTAANTSSAPWWWEEDLALTPSAAVTRLSVLITVARTAGVTYSGSYSTAAGGVRLSAQTGARRVFYRAVLTAGWRLPAGTTLRIGVQFGGNGRAHALRGDSYRVTATVGGRIVTHTGRFA